MRFTVIDSTTGKEPDLVELARTLWPLGWHPSYHSRTYCLALASDGYLLLTSTYGCWTELPANRFIVKMEEDAQ